MKARKRRWIWLRVGTGAAVGTVAVALFVSIVAGDKPACVSLEGARGKKSFRVPPCSIVAPRTAYLARIETSLGPITFRMNTILGPKAVNNVVFLARAGFYEGLTFHRVQDDAKGAFVQGGDPDGTGRGGPGYSFEAEAPSPITRYFRGVVALLRRPNDPASYGSQFFIVARELPELAQPRSTPIHAVVGFVDGDGSFATLDKIIRAPRSGAHPSPPIRILRMTVEEVPRAP